MFENAKILTTKVQSCPFTAVNMNDPIGIFASAVNSLPERGINPKSIAEIATRVIKHIPPSSELALNLNSETPESQVEFLAKGVLYQLATKHLESIVATVLDCKAQAERTAGIGKLIEHSYDGLHIVPIYEPHEMSKTFARISSPIQLTRQITEGNLSLARQVCIIYAVNLYLEEPREHKLMSTLMGFLPGRKAADLGQWLASGFEAATMLGMDLCRVNLYRCIIDLRDGAKLGELGKDYTVSDLEKLAENSKQLLVALAGGSFDTFNAQRAFVAGRTQDDYFRLRHSHFRLHGKSGDPELHVDFKFLPIAGYFENEEELVSGCPGRRWIGEFHKWTTELHSRYFIPNIPNIFEAAFQQIRSEPDSSADEYLKLREDIKDRYQRAGIECPF